MLSNTQDGRADPMAPSVWAGILAKARNEIRQDRVHCCVLGLICLIALVVRVAFLFQPMRYDEASTFVRYASQPAATVVTLYTLPNNHLFYTLLARLAYLVLGNEPWILRLPALIAGLLLVPASYLATRLLYNRQAALLTAGLMAVSFPFVFYSTNARGYTLVCLIFVMLLSLATVLTRSAGLPAWLAFTLLTAIGFFTIPVMLYPFGLVTTWLFLSILREPDRRLRAALLKRIVIFSVLALLLALLAYVPVFLTSGPRAVFSNRFVVPHTRRYLMEQFPVTMLALWEQWNTSVPWAVSALLAVGAFVALAFHRRLARTDLSVSIGLLIGVLPVMLVQRVVPPVRVWMFILPIYLAMASAGAVGVLSALEPRLGRLRTVLWPVVSLVLCAWIGVNLLQSQSVGLCNDTGRFVEAEAITADLKGQLQPGDRIVATDFPGKWPLEYYFVKQGISTRYFGASVPAADRLIVVVNHSYSETVDSVLSQAESSVSGFGAPQILRDYETATLYEAQKLDN